MQNLKGDAEEEETFLNNIVAEKSSWSHFAVNSVQLCMYSVHVSFCCSTSFLNWSVAVIEPQK